MCLIRLYLLFFHLCVSIVSGMCVVKSYGESCHSDDDCAKDLICERASMVCKCQRYYWFFTMTNRRLAWDTITNRCYMEGKNHNVITDREYDKTRDVVIPSIVVVSLAITASLCYHFFCVRYSWWRRRRVNNMARGLEETQLPFVAPSQAGATWIASYRVFGTVERTRPAPCLLLPVGPPPYEEALKHKVILSSSQPPMMMHTTPL